VVGITVVGKEDCPNGIVGALENDVGLLTGNGAEMLAGIVDEVETVLLSNDRIAVSPVVGIV
jgi:hypothetical protein